MGEQIKFSGNRFQLFLSEILEHFGITKLASGDRIWIKQHDEKDCRGEPYEKTSRLSWTEIDKSVIVLSPEKPPQSALINNNAYTPIENKTYEQNLSEQVRLWRAKKEREAERPQRISRAIEARTQAKYIVIKRKRKLRREREIEKNTVRTSDIKNETPDG